MNALKKGLFCAVLCLEVHAALAEELTPEQQILMLLLKQKPGGAQAAQNETKPPQIQQETEDSIGNQFSKLTHLESGVSFERFRDGFSLDGQRYIDPEGKIVVYGFDSMSGDFTYAAETGTNQYIIKSGRALNQIDPIPIASAVRQGPFWQVTTASGKKLSGQRLIPLARGFIVARENTGFRYIPGKGMTNIVAPEEFSIAPFQNGDVSGTGYLLLERTPEANGTSGKNPAGGLLSSLKSLGSTLGVSTKEDYVLLNIDTKKTIPINIAMDGKRVQVMSGCRKRSTFINECEKMDSYESLFDKDGFKNMSHYFWRIYWFNAEGKPLLVSQEGGLSKISATNLDTGNKVNIFERALGISEFRVWQDKAGKINVTAKMGFSSETKNDIAASLSDATPANP